MAKTKTPFFSMGSQGTISDALTSQKRGSETIIRAKPTPTDRQSLPQMYQRWLYEDYAYLWTQQSAATKQTYATAGSRYHLTGFQFWMRYNLINLPDIDLWWRLDEGTLTTATDFSKNGLDGTVFGATPQEGIIDGQLSFDGLNDRVAVARHPALDFTTNMTIECFYTIGGINRWNRIISFDTPVNPRYLLYQRTTNVFEAYCNDGINGGNPASPLAYTGIGDTYHLACRIDPNSIDLFVGGYQVATAVVALSNFSPTGPFQVGCYSTPPGNHAHGGIDNVIKYNRRLDDADILRHSLRRYPLQ